MGLEIEAKMKASDHGALIERLRAAGGTRVEMLAETNVFLDTAEGSLRAGDCGLRVRLERNVERPEASRVVITHKGPRKPGPIKQRDETELHAADLADAIALLGVLGYAEQLRFEKRRERWRLDRCTIELDELPRIGKFVEIEGPDEATVMTVRERLGLANEPMIREGYASMVGALLEREPSIGRSLEFE